MKNIYLCTGKYAKNPYYVKYSDINLYSIEELCYYFVDKIYLLNDDLMCRELVEWIEKECGMEELARVLDDYLRKHLSLALFITTILEHTGIYDVNIISKVERFLKEQATLTPFEKEKKRADYYYQTGRFRQALIIYTELFERTGKQEATKRAVLCFNIASIYAMDFNYDRASLYYEESYRLLPNVQTRQAYILAKRLSMNDYEFGEFEREHEKWSDDIEEVEELIEQCREGWKTSKERQYMRQAVSERQQGELLRSLKEDYRRQTL